MKVYIFNSTDSTFHCLNKYSWCLQQISNTNWFVHIASFISSTSVMNLAFVLDRAIVCCRGLLFFTLVCNVRLWGWGGPFWNIGFMNTSFMFPNLQNILNIGNTELHVCQSLTNVNFCVISKNFCGLVYGDGTKHIFFYL